METPKQATVFSTAEENELAEHIRKLASRGFGLTQLEIRGLAYQYAEKNEIKHKFNNILKLAGYDWFQGFYKRNLELSVRHPEALSFRRASRMNRGKVDKYFELLQETLTANGFLYTPKKDGMIFRGKTRGVRNGVRFTSKSLNCQKLQSHVVMV